jgi:dTDP-4-dehydrorhamnose reductase
MLVTGAGGQLGFELARALAPLGDVILATRDGRLPGASSGVAIDLDVPAQVAQRVRELRPDWVVNAAAYTAVDRAEDEPEAAFRANAESVGALARACAEIEASLLHYSTDYVFPGTAKAPLKEEDPVEPLGVYGASKRAGELAIMESGCAYLILRTAWVYAARGHNFLRTMLRLGAEREQLSVVADQRGAPTSARWIASASALLIQRCHGAKPPRELLHLTASGECSWFEFAQAIFARAHAAGLLARVPELRAIATADYPTRARRPAYSKLDNARLRERFGLQLPDWRDGLDQVLGELASR